MGCYYYYYYYYYLYIGFAYPWLKCCKGLEWSGTKIWKVQIRKEKYRKSLEGVFLNLSGFWDPTFPNPSEHFNEEFDTRLWLQIVTIIIQCN